jgi:polyphosphate:AMP phosphotransferase
MFESANLAHEVKKSLYKREEPKLREQLLAAQSGVLADGSFTVLILIAGVQGAGRGQTVNLLNEWMDPRHVQTRGFGAPTQDERERPEAWRYWNALPPKGKVGVFFGAWHSEPIMRRVRGETSDDQFAHEVAQVSRLEKMLADEGVLLLKYWFHISKAEQKKRLKKARERLEAPYKKFVAVSEAFLRRTSAPEAPWTVIPGFDARYRALTFGRHLLAAIETRLAGKKAKGAVRAPAPRVPPADKLNVIRALQLSQPMSKSEYRDELDHWQRRLTALSQKKAMGRVSVVGLFEGNDAAGKGGAIRRITSALDARIYDTIAIAAPTDEERAQPYLWRFWRRLPRLGRFAFFDRSWYGRVLVERVEGFAAAPDFEQALTRHGTVIVKYWLAISKEEQLRRFREREKVSFKRFKITPEDWRNRKKWDDYEQAVCDMVDRTSTSIAPWTLVEANNKYYARIKVLKTLCAALEDAF